MADVDEAQAAGVAAGFLRGIAMWWEVGALGPDGVRTSVASALGVALDEVTIGTVAGASGDPLTRYALGNAIGAPFTGPASSLGPDPVERFASGDAHDMYCFGYTFGLARVALAFGEGSPQISKALRAHVACAFPSDQGLSRKAIEASVAAYRAAGVWDEAAETLSDFLGIIDARWR